MERNVLNLLVSVSLLTAACVHAADTIDYPDGYRTWTHITSMVLHKGHPLENPFLGILHVCGNEQAVSGTKTGQFADGATLVFYLLEYVTQDNASTEAGRALVR